MLRTRSPMLRLRTAPPALSAQSPHLRVQHKEPPLVVVPALLRALLQVATLDDGDLAAAAGLGGADVALNLRQQRGLAGCSKGKQGVLSVVGTHGACRD